jgi:hypothetical protein
MALYDVQTCELAHQNFRNEGPVLAVMDQTPMRSRKRYNDEDIIEIVDPPRADEFLGSRSKDDQFLNQLDRELPAPKPFSKSTEKYFDLKQNDACGKLVSSLYPNSSKVRAVVSLLCPHTILSVSDSFVRWLGYTSQEIVGRSLKVFSGPRTDTFALNAAIKNAAVHNFECIESTIYSSSGTAFHVLVSCFPFMDVDGVLLGCSIEIKHLGANDDGLIRIPFPSRISPADAARRRNLNYQTGLALHREHAAAAAAVRAEAEADLLESLLAEVM